MRLTLNGLSSSARRLAACLATATLAFAIGCGGGQSTDGGSAAGAGTGDKAPDGPAATSVEFWHAMSQDHNDLLQAMADEFNAAHPDWPPVKLLYQGRYDQLKLKLNTALATGNAPPMAQVYETWTTSFMQKKHLHPAHLFIEKEGPEFQAVLDDIYPAFLDNNKWDGEIMTLPFNKSTYVLFYNATMFKAAGYDEFPKTFDELWVAAQKLTKRDANGEASVYGIGLQNTLEPFSVLMHAFGGRFHQTVDGKLVVVDNEQARTALTKLVELRTKEKVLFVDDDYMSRPFGSGIIALFWGSSAGIPFVEKSIEGAFEWRAASMPDGSGNGSGGHLCQGTNIAIFAKSTDMQKTVAWEFTKFLLQPKNAAVWAAKTGYLPVRKAALEEPVMKEYIAATPSYQVCLDQIPTACFEPRESYWEDIRNQVAGPDIRAAMQGEKTPAEALESIEKKAERTIQDTRR